MAGRITKTDNEELFKYREEYEKLAKIMNYTQQKINDLESDRESAVDRIREITNQEIELIKKGISRRTKLYKELLKEKKALQDSVSLSEEKLNNLNETLKTQEELAEKTKKLANTEKESVKYAEEKLKKTLLILSVGKSILDQAKAVGKYYNEQDKAIKDTQLSMGILSDKSGEFSKRIFEASKYTSLIGMQSKDIAIAQGKYSETLGRTVSLSNKGLKSISLMAKGSMLGAEGSAEFAANMDNFGINAERSADFVEDTLNSSYKMGVNGSVATKNIVNGLKLAQRYNFKDGLKNMQDMAIAAGKYKISLDSVAGVADKLFDIEGAVNMSSQLQVLGGEWAKMADPFKLMHMARTDMKGLYDEIVNATAGVAQFNKETNSFDISPLEQHRLRRLQSN